MIKENNSTPLLGEIRKTRHTKSIFIACQDCGEGRWVRIEKGSPRNFLRCRPCAAVARIGMKLSEEAKLKISRAHMGRPLSLEVRRKMSLARRGKPIPNFRPHPHTEESRRKISMALRGRSHSAEWVKKSALGNTGKIVTEETKLKQSLVAKDRWGRDNEERRIMSQRYMGNNNPNWQGGISFEPYTYEFNKQLRELIRLRDGYICQLCGVPECECKRQLDIHHIDYDKENCLPTNLISLCNSCNTKANFNREYWTEYFRQRLNERQLNPKSLGELRGTKVRV